MTVTLDEYFREYNRSTNLLNNLLLFLPFIFFEKLKIRKHMMSKKICIYSFQHFQKSRPEVFCKNFCKDLHYKKNPSSTGLSKNEILKNIWKRLLLRFTNFSYNIIPSSKKLLKYATCHL